MLINKVRKMHSTIHFHNRMLTGKCKSYFRKMQPMNDPIDFVVMWVDGDDPKWLSDKSKYDANISKKGNGPERFRDWDQFYYWYRSIEKYAPWVRKVFLVTYGHIPKWINLECPKLCFIKHSDFIPEKYRPTFSTYPIYLNLFRINELSEHFVLFDDDMYLASCVQPADFFEGGLPKICALSYLKKNTYYNGPYAHQVYGNSGVINSLFNVQKSMLDYPELWFSKQYRNELWRNKFAYKDGYLPGIYETHLPLPLRKTDFAEMWKLIPSIYDETCTHKFRTYQDITLFTVVLFEVMTGQFVPVPKDHFGKVFQSLSTQCREIEEAFSSHKHKCICLNDSIDVTEENFDEVRNSIEEILNKEFPEKSQFEI